MRDLEGRIESQESLLVSIGAPRLRRLGLTIAEPFGSPEHRLYELLRSAHGDAAHSRYNALIRRLVSYERSAAIYSRPLAELERSHVQDVEEVRPIRFPAVDAARFPASVEGFIRVET